MKKLIMVLAAAITAAMPLVADMESMDGIAFNGATLVTANPPTTISTEFVDHAGICYGEGDTARIKILLSQGLGASTAAYAYLIPLDEASSNYVAFVNGRGFTNGVRVANGMTEASSYVELNLLDGCSDTALLSYELQLWSGAKWESRGTQYTSYISDDLMLTVTNKVPSIGSVSVSGAGGLVEENGGELKTKVAKNVDKVFSIRSVNDVQADQTNNLKVAWSFTSPNGFTRELTAVQGALEELVVTNKFSLMGVWTAQAVLTDKDGGVGPVFSFRFEVPASPEVQIKFPASNIYNECDVDDGTAFFYVDLSQPADEDLTVAVKKTCKGADGIMDIGDDDSGMLYVDIPAGETRKTVQIVEFDGTAKSANYSTGGFMIEAYVTNGVENSDGVAYSNVYQKVSEQIFVSNARPRLDLAYIPGTNPVTALKGVDVSIPYLVSDVMADLTNGLTLTWMTSEGAVSTTNAYQGTFKTRFADRGYQYVTLAIVDKDGGRSMQKYMWLFFIVGGDVIVADGGYEWILDFCYSDTFTERTLNIVTVLPEPTGDLTIPSTLDGNTVTSIGSEAFYGSSGLTSVTIPDSVTNIGSYAFYNCSGLTSVIFKGNAPSVGGSSTFSNVKTGCTAYVKNGSIGWGVDIPGTWNGLNIQYLTPEVEIAVANEVGEGTVEIEGELPEVEVASGVTLVVKGENLDAVSLAAKITPKPHEAGQSASFFKVETASVSGGVSLAVVLDEEAVNPDETAAEIVDEETVAVFDAAADGGNVSVNLPSAKPGLYYGIAAAGDLAHLDEAAANVPLVQAGEGGATVPVTKPVGGAAFFKVVVSDRAR